MGSIISAFRRTPASVVQRTEPRGIQVGDSLIANHKVGKESSSGPRFFQSKGGARFKFGGLRARSSSSSTRPDLDKSASSGSKSLENRRAEVKKDAPSRLSRAWTKFKSLFKRSSRSVSATQTEHSRRSPDARSKSPEIPDVAGITASVDADTSKPATVKDNYAKLAKMLSKHNISPETKSLNSSEMNPVGRYYRAVGKIRTSLASYDGNESQQVKESDQITLNLVFASLDQFAEDAHAYAAEHE